MDPVEGVLTGSGIGAPSSGELLDPAAELRPTELSEVVLGMEGMASGLIASEAGPSTTRASRFLVDSDASRIEPPQGIQPRLLFQSLGSSLMSLGSGKRKSNRFQGFLQEPQDVRVPQGSPTLDAPLPVRAESQAAELLKTKKSKVSAPLMGLKFLEYSSSICGASIGNSGRFCLLNPEVCIAASHKKSSSKSREIPLSCWVIVLENPSRPSAFYSPFVTKETGENNKQFQNLLKEKRELTQWTRLMMAITGSVGVSEDQKIPLENLDKTFGAATPYKKVSFSQLDEPSSYTTSEEWSLQDRERWGQLKIAINDINQWLIQLQSQLGIDPGVSDGPITSAWEGIKMISDQYKETEGTFLEQGVFMNSISAQTDRLEARIHQMQTLGYPSVKDLANLGALLQRNIDKVKPTIMGQLELSLTPLLQQHEATLSSLGTEIDVLKNTSPIRAAPSTAISVGTAALEKRLTARIDSLTNKIDSKAVQIGPYVFSSLDHCVSFATKGIPEGEFQWFMDIVTYLQFVGNEVVNSSESQASELHASRVKRSEEQSIVIGAFKTDIPPVFGGPSAGRESKTAISGMGTFKQWDTGDGELGLKNRITHSLTNQFTKLMSASTLSLGGHPVACQLASSMLNSCNNFWVALSTFINSFYTELLTNTYGSQSPPGGSNECWELVMKIVRTLFSALRKVRVIAESAHSMTDKTRQVGLYLWASLQAHRVMAEYVKADFKRHPDVAPNVTFFLFENRAPKSTVVALKKENSELSTKVAKLDNELQQVRRMVDKLVSNKR